MKLLRTYSFLILLLTAFVARAEWFPEMQRKGNFFGGWGWNRSMYTNSDIHFQGAFFRHDIGQRVLKNTTQSAH